MRVRQLSPTGDYTFGSSALNFYVNSPAGVAQIVGSALRLWVGEWYLNIEDGTPYPEGVLGFTSEQVANMTIQGVITGVTVIDSTTLNSVQAVTSIDNFSSSLDPVTRKYTATGTLNTIYGPTQLEIEDYATF